MADRSPLKQNKRGASLGTYGLLVGLISVVGLVAVTSSGSSIKSLFETTATSMEATYAPPTPVPSPSNSEPVVTGLNPADMDDVAVSSEMMSDIMELSGFSEPAAVSVSGGEYRLCADGACSSVDQDWGSANGSATSGQFIQIRMTSASSTETPDSMTVTVGQASATWTVTTGTCPTSPQNFSSGTSTNVTIVCTGTYRFDLRGSRGNPGNMSAGNGARLIVDVALTAGDSVQVVVGNNSGYNGGGAGTGNGGGATDIRVNGTSLNDRVAVAGGGGGGDGDNWQCNSSVAHGGGGSCGADYCGGSGGAGYHFCGGNGGVNGGSSGHGSHGGGGGGGGRDSGGVGASSNRGDGGAGSFGQGGAGRECSNGRRGGGGGGWYGGGGAAGNNCGNGQGGGGSSYWGGAGVTFVSHSGGAQNGNGAATMTPP
ncbi:MAG: hypothetical protein Alpg2KO_30800 [Alphaproteobacteria bacterium]